jgi:hypothetical protein
MADPSTSAQDYDWRVDAVASWELAIAELRRRGLAEGRYKPETDEERAYVEAERSRVEPAPDVLVTGNRSGLFR